MPPLGASAPDAWQRLDRRMLLVHPVTELIRYIPVLIATLFAGARSDSPMWSLAVVAVIVGFALTRWFTTTYRITPENVELRTGLLQRKRLSVPRNRVRSVDVQADLLHRVLGLAVLTIGTGQHAEKRDQFKLDSLDAKLVPPLRTALLAHTRDGAENVAEQSISQTDPNGAPITTGGPRESGRSTAHEPVEIAHWQSDWVRYAPLSLTGFAIIAPVVGLAFQYGFAQIFFKSDTAHEVGQSSAAVITGVIALLFVALLIIVSLAGCVRYLMTWYGLRVLDDGTTLTVRHGLFTTRQTTLDLARLRGATVNEPLLLRLARAGELEAIMTGTSPRQKILPQAPRPAVDRTLAYLLGIGSAANAAATQPFRVAGGYPGSGEFGLPAAVTVPLRAHGAAAMRRRYTRTLGPLAAVAVLLAVISLAGGEIPGWLWVVLVVLTPFAAVLAWDRYRGLGHAVIPAAGGKPAWLVTRSGSLDRDRDCLEAPGIIGWTVRQTFFQRRAGVATVVAASAAGKKRYHVLDLPVEQAWALIEAVTPGQLGTPRVK
ncbi:PH domain-containing protein [Nocardia sp. NBC_00511]|uniref:PH domain-containing protein n=1 Tax=Nocardia sp. NBC_00511 TaxID=2903591 RepID=UPI0030DED9CC